MDNVDNKDALLIEYQCYHNTLTMISNIQNVLFIFAITSIGTLLAFAIQQENPYIPMVGYIILILIKCRLIYYRDEYYLQHAYIRVIIEPKLKINSFVKGKIKINKFSNIHYFTFTVLAMGIFFTYLIYYTESWIFLISSLFFLIIIILLDCYFLFYSNKLYKKIVNQYAKFESEKS